MATKVRTGTTARGRRTRDAVVAALHDLLREGVVGPTARQVAERAGVSLRSVYVHFASVEDLYVAVHERAVAVVLSMLTPIDPAQPLPARVDLLCSQRATVHEELAPLQRAAARHRASSPALQEAQAFGRAAARDQIGRVFGPELDTLDASSRRRRSAAIDAATSAEAWEVLRAVHELAVDEARLALVEAVSALLADVASG